MKAVSFGIDTTPGFGSDAACDDPLSPTSPTHPSRVSAATSGKTFSEPAQTLVFFDWDDTLFPTTDFMRRWDMPQGPDEKLALSDEQRQELESWGDLLNQFLHLICGLSDRVVVITNSKRPWVDDCVRHFAPRIQPLLDREGGVHVVYAREVYADITNHSGAAKGVMYNSPEHSLTQEEMIEEYTAWKYAAMKREASQFYGQYPGQTWKNILSFGDQPYEHYAVQELDFKRNGPSRERLRIKSYVVPPGMSVPFHCSFLRFLLVMAPILVQHDGDFRMGVEAAHLSIRERMTIIGEQLGIPDLPSVALQGLSDQEAADPTIYAQPSVPSQLTERMAEALDDVVMLVQERVVD